MTRSLVTGGCGFVGRHLADALADRGDEVTAVDVRGKAWRDDVAVQIVDIRDPDAIADAIEGHDVVFHNASLVHTRRSREEDVWAVNLGGTDNVLAACRKHGIRKLVYVSSASVVYEGADIQNGDESLGYARTSQAAYADSKIAAEKKLLAQSDDALATCSIRPHVIFGPGDTRLLPAILERARQGKMKFSVGNGTHLSDFTYVTNLTDALLAAEERLEPGSPIAGEAFFVTNGEPMPFFAFVSKVLAHLDLPPIRGRVPYFVAYSVAAAKETWDTVVRGGTLNSEDGFSRFAVRYLCTHHYFDIGKAKRMLDWAPQVSLEDGILRTVETLRDEPS
ncbi:MAG: NAD-dependent epimerase/dehydratase family protein [Deltaproteobacteria bacterium]|nr:NAD-dependent epimerase/dehydratase family protein [Deltaproteobacteria bacterium]